MNNKEALNYGIEWAMEKIAKGTAEIERLTAERDLALANADGVYANLMTEIERLRAALKFVVENTGFGTTQAAVNVAREALVASRVKVIGRNTKRLLDGEQAPGMQEAICHACGLGYRCTNEDCPNDKPNPMWAI